MMSDETCRVGTSRTYLMCPPTHFAVTYAINPWMRPYEPADAALATRQWERLRQAYLDLGHEVQVIDPVPGLPDMVFAANGATVIDGTVLGVRFRHPERNQPR
jgi:N-dimethylarginine dimethylaminohydrolase